MAVLVCESVGVAKCGGEVVEGVVCVRACVCVCVCVCVATFPLFVRSLSFLLRISLLCLLNHLGGGGGGGLGGGGEGGG